MRTISKYISFALMAFAVVACHTNDIDNPDNPDNPNPPQISDNVTFTASIKQTRVEYTPNGDKLDQCWKPNDVIYGFYGEGSGSKIILQVTDVDSNGYAKLEPLYDTGPAFVAALKESVKNKKTLEIGMIYTGKTISSKDSYSNSISIGNSFLDQSTGQIPACMSCSLYDDSKTDEDGNTIVEFMFNNDCAILEIKGITGAKEEADLSDGGKAELISITVTNTCYYFKYSYDRGALSLDTNTDYLWDTCVEPESLYIDSNGNIVDSDGNSASVMIAVVPNEFKKDINVTAKISGGDTFGSSYNTDFAAGTCYVIRQKDVVAKTEDGLYFTSVSGAFRRAEYLNEHSDLLNGKTNTVTLVKDYIDGLNEDVDHEVGENAPTYEPIIIDIDYPVTLDLNGCTLSLDCYDSCEWDSFYSGGFKVESGGTLTIDDRKGSGCINSGSIGIPIITSSGTVNILGGSLSHWESGQAIKSTGGTVNVSGGRVYAWGNSAITLSNNGAIGYITGGVIGNKAPDSTGLETVQILNGADCTISGGLIYSKIAHNPAVACRSTGSGENASTLTITWPNEIAPSNPAADIKHEPFICCCTEYYSYAPVSAYDALNNNTAEVTIKGGYLITTANQTTSAYEFYAGDKEENGNLALNEFGGFYTNSSWIHLRASGETDTTKLTDPGDLSDASGLGLYGDFIAIPQNTSYGFSKKFDDETTLVTGKLYYITKKQQ